MANNGTKIKIGKKVVHVKDLLEDVAIVEKDVAITVGDIVTAIEKLYGDLERFKKELSKLR